MAVILSAIVLMSLFQAEYIENADFDDSTSDHASAYIVLVGIFAALSFSFEAMFINWLAVRHVPGTEGGYLVLFFDGVYGTILLIIITAMGEGLQLVEPLIAFETILGGVFTSLALVLVNYSIANGISGIAFSIANSFPAWHAIFNWLILGKILSSEQLLGVLLAVCGSVILFLHKPILEKVMCYDADKDAKAERAAADGAADDGIRAV